MDAAHPHRGPTPGTHTGDPHRGPAQGTQGTRTGDPHRGPTQGTHTEGRAPQRTHHRRGGPHRGPTQNTQTLYMNNTGRRIRATTSESWFTAELFFSEGGPAGLAEAWNEELRAARNESVRTGGGIRRKPTTGGEGPTGDPHRTHTDTPPQREVAGRCV